MPSLELCGNEPAPVVERGIKKGEGAGSGQTGAQRVGVMGAGLSRPRDGGDGGPASPRPRCCPAAPAPRGLFHIIPAAPFQNGVFKHIYTGHVYFYMPATMRFMKHIKKADRNYLLLPYSLSCVFGGGERDNKDLFHFAVCCGMPCSKLRSEVWKNAAFFFFPPCLFNAILSWKEPAEEKRYLQAIGPEPLFSPLLFAR